MNIPVLASPDRFQARSTTFPSRAAPGRVTDQGAKSTSNAQFDRHIKMEKEGIGLSMRRVRVGIVVTVPLIALGGLVVASLWLINGTIHGCTSADMEFSQNLKSLGILDAHPAYVTAKGDRYSGCDDDDGFAFAGQYYGPMASRDAVKSFYVGAAEDQGWLRAGDSDSTFPRKICFKKKLNEAEVYLGIWFPGDFEEGSDDGEYDAEGNNGDKYGVEVTGGRHGSAWC